MVVELRWKRADHSMIFVFIAATYTPIAVLGIGGTSGMWMLAVAWIGAVLGALRALLWVRAPRVVATALYLMLGWLGIGFWPVASGGDDVASICRSIVSAIELAGVDHVGLGSDFDGAVPTPFDATGMPLLTEALLAEGLSDDDIGAVMGGNAVRLLAAGLSPIA